MLLPFKLLSTHFVRSWEVEVWLVPTALLGAYVEKSTGMAYPIIFQHQTICRPTFLTVTLHVVQSSRRPGTGFQVSGNAGVAPVRFDNINPTYSSVFQTFSPQRLFTAVGSNILDVNFFVAGTNTPASVSGFGSIFTDVDLNRNNYRVLQYEWRLSRSLHRADGEQWPFISGRIF
jgi:hypothetical protein